MLSTMASQRARCRLRAASWLGGGGGFIVIDGLRHRHSGFRITSIKTPPHPTAAWVRHPKEPSTPKPRPAKQQGTSCPSTLPAGWDSNPRPEEEEARKCLPEPPFLMLLGTLETFFRSGTEMAAQKHRAESLMQKTTEHGFGRVAWGRRSAKATKKAARDRWKAPCCSGISACSARTKTAGVCVCVFRARRTPAL